MLGTAAWFLAQALWEDGDRHDRERALALADDADRDLAQAITDAQQRPYMIVTQRLLERRVRDLAAWRARHRS